MTSPGRNPPYCSRRAAASIGCCGGGAREEPVNTDYSALRLAPSHEGALSYATSDEQLLRAVRNGLRMSLVGAPQVAAVLGITAPAASNPQGTFSSTTVQVDGVDEADLVKYDGQLHLHDAARRACPRAPASRATCSPIARTDPATAGDADRLGVHGAGEQTRLPQLYQLQSEQGSAEFLAAVSQDFRGWMRRARGRLHGARSPTARASSCWTCATRQRLAGVGNPARRLAARQPQDRRHALSGEQLSAATRGHPAARGHGRTQACERVARAQCFGGRPAAELSRERQVRSVSCSSPATACWRPISASTTRTRTSSSSRPSICRSVASPT